MFPYKDCISCTKNRYWCGRNGHHLGAGWEMCYSALVPKINFGGFLLKLVRQMQFWSMLVDCKVCFTWLDKIFRGLFLVLDKIQMYRSVLDYLHGRCTASNVQMSCNLYPFFKIYSSDLLFNERVQCKVKKTYIILIFFCHFKIRKALL